jgi:hypothetical protein
MANIPIPDAKPNERSAIATIAERAAALGLSRYRLYTDVQNRLRKSFGEADNGASRGVLNQKAQAWWEQTSRALGAALKTSFKLPNNPFLNPRTADEWEPYLAEKRSEVERLSREIANAEAEINDRVFRLFNLTKDEIALLMKEVEH